MRDRKAKRENVDSLDIQDQRVLLVTEVWMEDQDLKEAEAVGEIQDHLEFLDRRETQDTQDHPVIKATEENQWSNVP